MLRHRSKGLCESGDVACSACQAKESWELDTKEKLAEAAAKKDAGNQKFKAGKTAMAIKKYKVQRCGLNVLRSPRLARRAIPAARKGADHK